MKTILLKLIVLLIFSGTLVSQNKTFKAGFTGMHPNRYGYETLKQIDWRWYNELNVNTWQGWWIGDQEKEVVDSLNKYALSGYFQPDTLRWLGAGKVVIHEAESTAAGGSTVPRFRYNNHHNKGVTINDNWQGESQRVQYYEALPSGPYYAVPILTDVKENGIQSFSGENNDPMYECGFPGRDPNKYYFYDKWFIKPRMRIDSNDAHRPDIPIVKVEIHSYNGSVVFSQIIYTNHFLDANGNYNGKYLEEFIGAEISVMGDNTSTGINYERPDNWQDYSHLFNGDCKVDFQVYWYGQVSVWIDYVKVMDQPAENLMGTGRDPDYFRSRIKAKVQSLLDEDNGHNALMGFYTEEIEYSNLTCLKYEQDLLQAWFPSYSDKVKVVCLTNEYSYLRNLKERRVPEDYITYLQIVRPPAFMFTGYLLIGFDAEFPEAYLPPNINAIFPSYCPEDIQNDVTQIVNNLKVNYSTYTERIQTGIFDVFADSIDLYKEFCDSYGVDFYVVPHVCAIAYQWGFQNNREPMNSEMSTETLIAICHGAKGILPYSWESYYIPSKPEYQIGVGDFSTNYGYCDKKRELNFYGENKWNYVCSLYNKIKVWGPILANSPTTEGYSVNPNEGAVNKHFIYNIASIDPRIQQQNSCADVHLKMNGGIVPTSVTGN